MLRSVRTAKAQCLKLSPDIARTAIYSFILDIFNLIAKSGRVLLSITIVASGVIDTLKNTTTYLIVKYAASLCIQSATPSTARAQMVGARTHWDTYRQQQDNPKNVNCLK